MRHGRIRGYETKRFIGQTDVPLDDHGRNQAMSWQNPLSHFNVESVCSSGLKRCRETASLAIPESNIRIEPRLNEIDMGTWDGKPFAEIKEKMPTEFETRGKDICGFRPPGGESFLDLQKRVLPVFNEYKKKELPCLLMVTHAGVIRVLLCHIQGMPPEDLFKIRPEYGQVFVISSG